MPDHQKFWVLHLADAIALLICFKKEKKHMKSTIRIATVLANLCWARPFPLLAGARSVMHIPQDPISPRAAAGTPGRETVSSPAGFAHHLPRQDLLFVMVLLYPLTGSSSDFLSAWKVPAPQRSVFPKATPAPPHWYWAPVRASKVGVWFLVAHCPTVVHFSSTWVVRLIHRASVVSQVRSINVILCRSVLHSDLQCHPSETCNAALVHLEGL